MAATNPSSSSHLSTELSNEMRLCLETVRASRSRTRDEEGNSSPGSSRLGQDKDCGGEEVIGEERGVGGASEVVE